MKKAQLLNKMTRQNFVRLLLGALITAAALQVQAIETRIAAVNSDRILRESVSAKDAQKRLEQEFSKRGRDLQQMEQRLKSLADSLAEKGAKLSSVNLEKKQRELAQLDIDLQRKKREFQEDLNRRRNEDLIAVLDSANKAIKQIAEKENYDLIIQEAVYINPRIDITDKVLKVLEDANTKVDLH